MDKTKGQKRYEMLKKEKEKRVRKQKEHDKSYQKIIGKKLSDDKQRGV